MKILKYLLESPYLIILISLILLGIAPYEHSELLTGLMCLVYICSIIYIIAQRKWRKLIISLIGPFLIITITYFFFYGFGNNMNPEIELGDSEFYKEEILRTSNLKIPNNLKLLSKKDTILHIGIEGEYDAECLYTGRPKDIKKLESKIISQKEFKKIDPNQDFSDEISKIKLSLKDIKSVYTKHSEGSYIIYFAIDNLHSKIYYTAKHY